MPEEPKVSTIVTNTSKGSLFTHTVSSSDKDLNEFMVSWTEYREDTVEKKATEKTFDKIRDAILVTKGGKLLTESASQFDGRLGRTVTFETSDGRFVSVKFGFFKNRFYQVMAETKRQNLSDCERFLNSFKLLPGTLV
jgi:NADPH:quinone reductase-like Zn-dependent oxidoreductase